MVAVQYRPVVVVEKILPRPVTAAPGQEVCHVDHVGQRLGGNASPPGAGRARARPLMISSAGRGRKKAGIHRCFHARPAAAGGPDPGRCAFPDTGTPGTAYRTPPDRESAHPAWPRRDSAGSSAGPPPGLPLPPTGSVPRYPGDNFSNGRHVVRAPQLVHGERQGGGPHQIEPEAGHRVPDIDHLHARRVCRPPNWPAVAAWRRSAAPVPPPAPHRPGQPRAGAGRCGYGQPRRNRWERPHPRPIPGLCPPTCDTVGPWEPPCAACCPPSIRFCLFR